MDRKLSQSEMIIAIVLIAIGVLALGGNIFGGLIGWLMGPLVMWAIAAPFLYIYLKDRRQWWALIPGMILGGIGLAVFLPDSILGFDLTGTLVMWSIAAPFLLIFFQDRRQWWALIPAYVMGAIGFVVLLPDFLDFLMGTLVMWIIAVPFLFVYLRDRRQWWALIPGGIMGLIGLVVLLGSSGSFLIAALLIGVGLYMLYQQGVLNSVVDGLSSSSSSSSGSDSTPPTPPAPPAKTKPKNDDVPPPAKPMPESELQRQIDEALAEPVPEPEPELEPLDTSETIEKLEDQIEAREDEDEEDVEVEIEEVPDDVSEDGTEPDDIV